MPLVDARIFHVNVNCSDLERSHRFYVEGLGFTEGAHTLPSAVQSGAAFGLEHALWDAWILTGTNGFDGGAIDLLEWKEPTPVGAAPAGVNECGFQRLGVLVPDLDAVVARVERLGGAVWSPPFEHALEGGGGIRLVVVSDPDGTAIELVEGDGPRLSFIGVACADLEGSVAFYRALGLREAARFPSHNDTGAHMRIDGPVTIEEVVMSPPGGGEVLLMLVGFTAPAAVSGAYRPANALGMWRAAMLVADLDASVAGLRNQGIITLSDPVGMGMGPGLPDLRFVCFAGPDGEIIELIEQPA